ncbi:MAG: hypothetical protein V1799_07365 [bacterium]
MNGLAVTRILQLSGSYPVILSRPYRTLMAARHITAATTTLTHLIGHVEA